MAGKDRPGREAKKPKKNSSKDKPVSSIVEPTPTVGIVPRKRKPPAETD